MLRDGSLGVVEDKRLLRVSLDAPEGSTLPGALVRDLAADDGFVTVDDKHAEGLTITPSGTLVAVSASERFGRVPTLVVPGVDGPAGAPVDADLDAPTRRAPATAVAGGDVAISFAVGGAASWIVETRSGNGSWRPARGAATGTATAAGPVTTTIDAPLVDGSHDLRVRTVTRRGAVDSDTEDDALRVTTPAGTATILQPTTAAPVTTPRNAAVQLRFEATQAGTYELFAVPAAGGRRVALDVPGPAAGDVPDPGAVVADFIAPADGTYDLLLRYRPGGGRAVDVIQPDALVVASPPKARVTMQPSADAPVTVPATGLVNIAVTTDQPGTLDVEWRRASAGQQPWTLVSRFVGRVVNSASTVTDTPSGPLDDGTYDLRARFTNAAGVVTTVLNKAALVINTPEPVVSIITPTTATPATSFASAAFQFEAAFNQSGEFRVESRPAGAADDAWRALSNVTFSEVSEPTAMQFHELPRADGTYDLRVVFRNAQGTQAVDVEPTALVVHTPQAQASLLKPTAQAPDTVLAGEVNYTTTTRADQNVTFSFDIRRAGTQTWIPVPDQGPRTVPPNQDWRVVHTLPVVPDGTYDVRMRFRNPIGIVTEIIEPGALVFATPPVTAAVEEPTTERPLLRHPGAEVAVELSFSAPADWELQIKPSEAGEEAFARVASGSMGNQFPRALISAPAAASAYDLRVVSRDVNGNTHVHDEPGALIVGAGPEAPVVINEAAESGPNGFTDQFVELRNVSAEPVDISGWQVVYCRTPLALGAVPDGVVLAPDEHFLFAGPDYPGGTGSDLPTEDAGMTNFFGSFDGIELLRAEGATVDSVSSYDGRLCYEGAPAPARQLDTESISRDANGTDTDDNATDFTVGPRTPTARARP